MKVFRTSGPLGNSVTPGWSLRGRVREGVSHRHRSSWLTPLSNSPPQGGREPTERAAPSTSNVTVVSLTHRTPAPKTVGKSKGEQHVQGSVFAEEPCGAGDRGIARHRQDDRCRVSQPGCGEGLHISTQGRTMRGDRQGAHG